MSKEAFNKVLRGLKEVQAFVTGERESYKITAQPSMSRTLAKDSGTKSGL